ncbi:hypothetical protein AT864_01845 [Anoxybacillus sp. P3H1B]|nr:hypothetical protein AT864_01845 [Anoxybacillus sp. P3H1B]MBB3907752.1 hypothetical protein [Anoxybacillus rupiensis]
MDVVLSAGGSASEYKGHAVWGMIPFFVMRVLKGKDMEVYKSIWEDIDVFLRILDISD